MTTPTPTTSSDIETAEEFITNNALTVNGIKPLEARDAAVAREAKLQALCDMHATAMRLRKYGREPEWLGAAFTELRAKYEKEPDAR